MKRAWILPAALFLWGCGGGAEERPASYVPHDPYEMPDDVKRPGYWGDYKVSREGTVRIIGTIEPLVAEENVYYEHRYFFVSDPAANPRRVHLYLDPKESGLNPGVWVGKRVAVVGHVTEDVQVGHDRTSANDVQQQIYGDVMRLVAVDVAR